MKELYGQTFTVDPDLEGCYDSEAEAIDAIEVQLDEGYVLEAIGEDYSDDTITVDENQYNCDDVIECCEILGRYLIRKAGYVDREDLVDDKQYLSYYSGDYCTVVNSGATIKAETEDVEWDDVYVSELYVC